jgi:hypothetical protein
MSEKDAMKMLKLSPLHFVLFLGVLHLLGASLSFAASPLEASWRMALSGVDSQDAQSSNKYVGFGLEAKSKYSLTPDLYFALDPLIRMENGSYQTIDGQRKTESGLYLKEAAAYWLFLPGSDFSAGALNQSKIHSELLVGDQAFPGVRVNLQVFRAGDFQTLLTAEQAIPTSTSLATNTTGVESTPRFLSASLALNYETSVGYWKTRAGAFSYDNLPSTVATESGLRGNTVLSVTEAESKFVYEYQGVEALTSLRAPMMRGWDLTTEASYLQNTRAKAELSRAYAASVGSEFFFIGRKSLDMKVTSFRIEPDAAVAFFNSNKFYNTNRVGYSYESFMNFKKYNFRLGARYTEAEVIFLNPTQSREKSLMLILETAYANI